MSPHYVTPPEKLERALRDLLRGWQEVAFAEPTATDDYRALTQQVILDAEASLEGGATPYEVMILSSRRFSLEQTKRLSRLSHGPTTRTRRPPCSGRSRPGPNTFKRAVAEVG